MKVDFQGKQVEAIEIEVIRVHEPWTECQLADGKVLMVKDVITAVYKLVGEKNPDGSDIYHFEFQKVIRIKK